jgi:Cu/Ag efflux protein CusF
MHFVANPYRILRASVLASALIGTALTLQMSEVLAQGGMSDMKKMPGMNDTKKATTANASGTITAVNPANHKVTFDHGPIPAINWPAMTMEFAVVPSVDLAKLKTGDKVNFTLSGSGGTYTVQSISPAS